MKIKLFKVGSLLYYSYMTNKELSSNALWLFDTDFKERASKYLEQFNIHDHYKDIDLRLYISNQTPSPFEDRIMKGIKDFETKCLVLGLIDYVKKTKPDISRINELIVLINHPQRTIKAAVKAAILNEFCTVETT